MSRNSFYLYGPAVPGAIAPVDATLKMTNEVGIKRCRLYVDAPTTAELTAVTNRVTALEESGGADTIEELQDDVTSLDNRVTTLENQQQAGGGNCYVEVPSQITCAADTLYVTYTTLPTGAVIDKYEFNLLLAGMTAPTKVEILPTTSSAGVTVVPDGGYVSWTIAHGTSGNVTIDTLTITLNTLLTHSIAANDYCSYARIYYHV